MADLLFFPILLAAFGYFSAELPILAIGFLGILTKRIADSISSTAELKSLLALHPTHLKWVAAGLASGIIAWLCYQGAQQDPLQWPVLGLFAITAAGIGLAEELAFRGVLFSISETYGALFAITYTTIAFTMYKLAVLLPHDAVQLLPVAVWTIVASIALGLLRFYSRSIWPTVANHALFDVLVYGGGLTGPAWANWF